jgi:hypothetical protein
MSCVTDCKRIKLLRKRRIIGEKFLFRIVTIVRFLGKHNLAFHGHNSKLYEDIIEDFISKNTMRIMFF